MFAITSHSLPQLRGVGGAQKPQSWVEVLCSGVRGPAAGHGSFLWGKPLSSAPQPCSGTPNELKPVPAPSFAMECAPGLCEDLPELISQLPEVSESSTNPSHMEHWDLSLWVGQGLGGGAGLFSD